MEPSYGRKAAVKRRTRAAWIGAVLTATGLIALAQEARAQTQLPGIVVEGGTIAARPSRRPSTPSEVTEAPPTPAPRPSQPSAGPAAGPPAALPPIQIGDLDGPTGGGTPSPFDITTDKLGTAVSVVTGEDIAKLQTRYAVDAIRALPGVSVSRASTPGSYTQVRIRGGEGNHTLVLIDGVEAGSPVDGEFDFSDLSGENIERIEVLKGPHSGLYGSGAVGGVINIVTKDGKGPLTLRVKGETGSMDTRDVSASLGGGNERLHAIVAYHARSTNGFNISPFGDETDSAKLATFSFKGGVKLLDAVTLNWMLRNSHKTGDRDGFGGTTPGLLATAIDDRSTFASDIWLGALNLKWEMLDGRLIHEFKTSRNHTVRTDIDRAFADFFSKNVGEVVKYGYLATLRTDFPALFNSRHTFSGLIEKETESFTPFADFGLGDGIERDRFRIATVGEWRGEFAERLFLTASVRHDDNSAFKDFTTWRTTATVKIPELRLRPHASAGTGVKFPTMFEQFGVFPTFFIANPNLQPEESFGWDAGVEISLIPGRVTVDVTYFSAELTNKIVTRGFPARPENLPGVSTRDGVEVSARVKLFEGLTIAGAYTYLDAKDPTGLREIRRPPHSGRIDVDYTFDQGRGNVRLGAVYNGTMEDLGFRIDPFGFASIQSRVTLEEYWLLTLAASYKVAPGVELFGRIENLLDWKYQEIYGFETAPLAAYAGVRLTFDEKIIADPGLPRR